MARITTRDIRILSELQERGRMTRVEIEKEFFDSSPSYVYKRMRALRLEGMVRSCVGKVDDVTTVQYWITELGQQQLFQGGAVERVWRAPERAVRKRKRNRAREWTERDVGVLEQLYRARTLTKRQIRERFFGGEESYCSVRIHVYKQEELLQSEVMWSKERKCLEAQYRITERGIRLLVERGLVQAGEVRARDLELSEKQRGYVLSAFELHFKIKDVPYLDSRAVKRKHSLNRGSLVVGSFRGNTGDYLIYILAAGVLETTVKKIVRELQIQHSGVGGYLIYCKDEAARHTFERVSKRLKLVTGGLQVHVLPYNERGIWITKELIFGKGLEELFGTYGAVTTLEKSRYGFRFALKNVSGEKYYVIETLTGDSMILDRVLREYRGVVSSGERMGALLFCWEEEVERYRERVADSHYVQIVPVTGFQTDISNYK